ncbi:MAG: hypothetical protein KF878_00195 [Planctomycetes bacterium]|nr:hypothetical protein [Planctomycetota bacterium]
MPRGYRHLEYKAWELRERFEIVRYERVMSCLSIFEGLEELTNQKVTYEIRRLPDGVEGETYFDRKRRQYVVTLAEST